MGMVPGMNKLKGLGTNVVLQSALEHSDLLPKGVDLLMCCFDGCCLNGCSDLGAAGPCSGSAGSLGCRGRCRCCFPDHLHRRRARQPAGGGTTHPAGLHTHRNTFTLWSQCAWWW